MMYMIYVFSVIWKIQLMAVSDAGDNLLDLIAFPFVVSSLKLFTGLGKKKLLLYFL